MAQFLQRSNGFGEWWQAWPDDVRIGDHVNVAQFRSATVDLPEQGPGVVQLIRCEGVIEEPGQPISIDLTQQQHLGLLVCRDVAETTDSLSEHLIPVADDIALPTTPLKAGRFALAWRHARPAALMNAAVRLSDALELGLDSSIAPFNGHGPRFT